MMKRLISAALVFFFALALHAQADTSATQSASATIADTIASPCADTMLASETLLASPTQLASAATADSLRALSASVCRAHRVRPWQVVVPVALITVGAIGTHNGWLQHQDNEIRDELQEDNHSKISLDNLVQYTPTVAVFALDICGVKGRHTLGQQAVLTATAGLLMAATVGTVKYTTRVERPDGSRRNSFPSGHTATAFMGAELLRREYGGVSPWIGVAGYAVATATAFSRLYNNRHWLTDVVAGAGVGILSANAAYWLYPFITRNLFPRLSHTRVSVSPFASGEGKGLACNIRF